MNGVIDTRPWLLKMPYDIIANVSQYLDLCSNTHLMDTCQQMRYFYLNSKYLWRKIVFDVNLYHDLHPIYSSLRKLDDSNGLRQLVTEVSDISSVYGLSNINSLKTSIGSDG